MSLQRNLTELIPSARSCDSPVDLPRKPRLSGVDLVIPALERRQENPKLPRQTVSQKIKTKLNKAKIRETEYPR